MFESGLRLSVCHTVPEATQRPAAHDVLEAINPYRHFEPRASLYLAPREIHYMLCSELDGDPHATLHSTSHDSNEIKLEREQQSDPVV